MSSEWKRREREINQPFVDELRVEITRSRMTPTEVARRAGFNQGQVSEWLNGATALSLGRYVALARASGLDAERISAMVKRAEEAARANPLVTPSSVSDPNGNVVHLPIAALEREIQGEHEEQ